MSGNKAIFLLLTVPFIWLLNKTRAPINDMSPCLTATPNSSIILSHFETTKTALFEKLQTLICNKIKINVLLVPCETAVPLYSNILPLVHFISNSAHSVLRTHWVYDQV